MVNFNNDTTIGTPAVDIQRVSILQRRFDFLEALEDYQKKRFINSGVPLNIVMARIGTLFAELQATLKRRLNPEEYLKVKEICLYGNTLEEIRDIYFRINEELDKMKLIKVDTYKSYDYENTEEENKNAGL